MFHRGRRKAEKTPLSRETAWKKEEWCDLNDIRALRAKCGEHLDLWGKFLNSFFNQLEPPWRSEANGKRVRRGPEERDKNLPVSMKLGNQKTRTERRDLPRPTPASFSPYSLAALSSSSFLPLSPPSFTLHELALMKRCTSRGSVLQPGAHRRLRHFKTKRQRRQQHAAEIQWKGKKNASLLLNFEIAKWYGRVSLIFSPPVTSPLFLQEHRRLREPVCRQSGSLSSTVIILKCSKWRC